MRLNEEQSYKVQILRGLAIIAVVFIHNTPEGLSQVIFRPFLNFSVGLFLFLSGLLSTADNWNPKKRITKVFVPYAIWTLLYVIIGNRNNLSNIPFAFLKGLLTAQAAAVMYYIFVYCQFTLLMPVIDKLARSKYRYIGFAIAPVEILVMRLIPLISGYDFNRYVTWSMGISCLGWFTYYYLGYMIGNDLLMIRCKTNTLVYTWIGAIALQMLEGYWYLSMGEVNCGTQLKLSSILAGTIFAILSYRFIILKKEIHSNPLKVLGDYSFGIYFSHLAVMGALNLIPYYTKMIRYPLNAIVTIFISTACVYIGKKILGKNSKYLAL